MKKKQGLRWGAMLGSGMNKGEMNEKLVTVGAAMLFDVVCAFFFLYSSASMLLEEFQLLKFGIGFYVKQLLLILFISAVMELAGHLKKLQEIGLKLAILLSGIFWIVWHLRKEKVWEEITSGLWSVGSVYLKEWNYYYDTSWYCPPGMALYATDSVEFVLLMVGLLLFWLAKCCKKNTVMAVVPVLIIIAELLVGNSPAGRGIFCVFAGILLAGNQSFSIPDFKLSEKHKGKAGKVHLFGWLPSVVVLSLLCMTVFLMGRKSAEEIVTTHAGELEDLIMNTANKVADWEFWRTIEDPGGVENMVDGVLGTIDFDRETLDNSEPVFEDIPVLRMTVERKPEGQIYLKGFYADTYENSVWKKNADECEQACREAGFEFEDVANRTL